MSSNVGKSNQVGFNSVLKQAGYDKVTPRCCAFTTIGGVAGLTLFILGCIGAAGAIPVQPLGWSVVALGSGVYLCGALDGRDLKKRKWSLLAGGIIALSFVVVGVLGGVNVLPVKAVGWGVIGISLVLSPIANKVITKCTPEGRRLQEEAEKWKDQLQSHLNARLSQLDTQENN